MSFLRPNKTEITGYRQTIKNYKSAKVTAPGSMNDYKWAWREISHDHYTKLRLDLKHITDRPLKDSLQADALEGEPLFNTDSYFRHYSDNELSGIAAGLREAKAGLDFIEKKLKAEQTRRNARN